MSGKSTNTDDITLMVPIFISMALIIRGYLRDRCHCSSTSNRNSGIKQPAALAELLMKRSISYNDAIDIQQAQTKSDPMDNLQTPIPPRSNYGKDDTVTLVDRMDVLLNHRDPSDEHVGGGKRTSPISEELLATLSPMRRRGASKGSSSDVEHLVNHLHKSHPHLKDAPGSPKNGSGGSGSAEDFQMLTPVSSSLLLAAPLVNRIDRRAETGGIIVIGVAGGTGSGKTTLAKAIYDTIGEENITLLSHDYYYKDLSHLSPEKRGEQNFDHPNSLETSLLVKHVQQLKKGQSVPVPSYDYATHSRNPDFTVLPPRPVVMVEGILIFCHPELYNLIDIKIFVDTDDDIRLIRRIQRDTVERGRSLSGIINQYVNTVRPMHMQFVEPSKRNADLIVPVGLNSVALDLVVSRLKNHLEECRSPT